MEGKGGKVTAAQAEAWKKRVRNYARLNDHTLAYAEKVLRSMGLSETENLTTGERLRIRNEKDGK